MSLLTRAAAALAAATVVLAPSALVLSPAHADPAAIPLPSADSFYTTDAGSLGDYTHGEVIANRPVSVTLNDVSGTPQGPYTAKQVLYRTRNASGGMSETVTTVIQPSVINPAAQSKGVVAYLSYYDGLSDTCDPSYTLQGATPNGEKFVIDALLAAGYTVTIPDFEGETLDWAAGHEAGWDTLDAITATEQNLGLPASTKVGMIGYSGGSIAGEWASELAPSYAAGLNIVGAAIGGVPVNLAHVMKYVDSSADSDRANWAGVIPAAMVSLSRGYGDDFSDILSSEGLADTQAVADKCIGDFAANYPSLHVADLLKPNVDFLNLPDVKQIVSGLVMGEGATPKTPMLMVQGNADGIGDGVMVAADVKALATTYCKAGLPVQYTEQAGKHAAVGASFMLQGLSYLGDRFAGKSAATNCATLLLKPMAPPTTVHATIKGHSKGKKDVLVVTVKGSVSAAGATVTITKAGHSKVLGHGVVAANGKVTIKVKDHNGSARTRYRAHVAATAKTSSATTKVLKLR
ncbi:lipase family protein [Nocardioides sp. BP30]|uniref:lipase family protein n=1 Tax=Nocardioides sp. BP30 TaxID=3036374 RepID=UPI0024697054|nr:lipase family protein [Nocardioides sp. BP30]WGL53831.1 lipase family protein [Nocardioides sp. BP30]